MFKNIFRVSLPRFGAALIWEEFYTCDRTRRDVLACSPRTNGQRLQRYLLRLLSLLSGRLFGFLFKRVLLLVPPFAVFFPLLSQRRHRNRFYFKTRVSIIVCDAQLEACAVTFQYMKLEDSWELSDLTLLGTSLCCKSFRLIQR